MKGPKGALILIVSLSIIAITYPFLPERIPVLFWLTGNYLFAPREFVFVFAIIPFVVYKTWRGKEN